MREKLYNIEGEIMSDNKIQFIPFHAINEFMLPEYRFEVIREVLLSLSSASEKIQAQFNKYFKNAVKVPGFRNSGQAPTSLKIRPFIAAFEKEPEIAGATLSRWVELRSELKNQVFDLLKSRNWEVLPADADRTKLPGFLIAWPDGEDFEVLGKAFQAMFPEVNAKSDDVSLMAVWLGGRLPYQAGKDDHID
jgi:hypothetical protein